LVLRFSPPMVMIAVPAGRAAGFARMRYVTEWLLN